MQGKGHSARALLLPAPPCSPAHPLACTATHAGIREQQEREEREALRKAGLLPPEPDYGDDHHHGRGSFDNGDPFTTNVYCGNLSPGGCCLGLRRGMPLGGGADGSMCGPPPIMHICAHMLSLTRIPTPLYPHPWLQM